MIDDAAILIWQLAAVRDTRDRCSDEEEVAFFDLWIWDLEAALDHLEQT